MAHADVNKKVSIDLMELTVQEAEYLKKLLQNSLTEDESTADRETRDQLFHALPSFESLGRLS